MSTDAPSDRITWEQLRKWLLAVHDRASHHGAPGVAAHVAASRLCDDLEEMAAGLRRQLARLESNGK